ncbi:hypothetical protein BU23DRAFT_535144 [Bimuria novae-zelandiae CBS 107.79]|uniref:Putative phospholipase n=1 Tax=Bimuria novae-zelandiae CBS 107.79 TaxID=1447943 RepID=A0A6A5V853_9PLEO|nr:hypothetical protein BU23DRAFT_535144 [Bimuria novae-zelandiae CBS 107.79]
MGQLLRKTLLFGSAGLLFVIFAVSLTPITSPLPPYTGQYEVGILDLETEVERREIYPAVLKETGKKAFELNTLAITLYYPSSLLPLPSRPWARPWLPQPVSLIGSGYARLIGFRSAPMQSIVTFLLWAFGSKTVIPGVVDAPVLNAKNVESLGQVITVLDMQGQEQGQQNIEEVLELRDVYIKSDAKLGKGTLPMVVFTHGMAGMSQSYSNLLGSIASHGYVVAAVEHRDGSGPGTIVHYPDGGERYVWHLKLDDLQQVMHFNRTDTPMTDLNLKEAQLNFREAEIVETIRLFERLNRSDGAKIRNLKPKSPESALSGFEDRLNMSAITVAGHSYGATGALQALKNAPSKDMPVNGAIVLDPGKGSGLLNHDIKVPTLVMQSGEWTEKQTEFYGQGWHFDVVKNLVEKTKQGWLMTLTGSAHPSCTDAPLIVPWIMKLATNTKLDSRVALREYISASVDFLEYLRNGEKKEVLTREVTSPAGPLGDAEKRGKSKGKYGADWEVHVVPTN